MVCGSEMNYGECHSHMANKKKREAPDELHALIDLQWVSTCRSRMLLLVEQREETAELEHRQN